MYFDRFLLHCQLRSRLLDLLCSFVFTERLPPPQHCSLQHLSIYDAHIDAALVTSGPTGLSHSESHGSSYFEAGRQAERAEYRRSLDQSTISHSGMSAAIVNLFRRVESKMLAWIKRFVKEHAQVLTILYFHCFVCLAVSDLIFVFFYPVIASHRCPIRRCGRVLFAFTE
jgi:hypothetical protein